MILVLVVSFLSFSEHAWGQQIQLKGFNHMGFRWGWPIHTSQYTFMVNTTANYDVQNVTFNKETKTLTFLGNSSHTGNIVEIEIPVNLIGGNYTVYQEGKQTLPIILKNGNLTTVILKFNDSGNVKTDIVGTTYLPEFSGITETVLLASFVGLFLTFRYRKNLSCL